MNIRQWLNENSALSTVIAVVMLVCALGYLVMSNTQSGPRGPKNYWFYDLEDKELFAASIESVAPIEAPSGGEGVRAFVYGCGDCEDLQIAWLQKMTPRGKAQKEHQDKIMKEEGIKGGGFMGPDQYMFQQLISKGDKIRWLPTTIPEAHKIQQADRNCPDGVEPKMDCFPDD